MPSVSRTNKVENDDPADRLVISLRSYVTKPKAKFPYKSAHVRPSDWVLVFDCETTTTPDQRLKFGTYQFRHKGRLAERGIFYEPDALTSGEKSVLENAVKNEQPGEDGETICFHQRHEFVEKVFFKKAHEIGAQIVGFNLPFDISRLAIRHGNARRGMKGGFSFVLVDDKKYPRVVVKHLSQRTSLIHFTGTKPSRSADIEDEEFGADNPRTLDRGYFVDVKTLAAVFTSQSHSLASLSNLLDEVTTKKRDTDNHGGTIDADYVSYAWDDTQATWECFDYFRKKFEALELSDAGLYNLYSEASLGKAYLKTMGIKPWRETQTKYSSRSIGRIMSAYYGGRSEVHIRRSITPIIHFDFLSMYPTVCTLMNLWPFVTAKGIREVDATEAIRKFVSRCTPESLRAKSAWKSLHAIVQVLPQRDLFPVRAHYSEKGQATIGLNYLTSDEPLWFTLADVLVSKILTGKTPRILKAVRFEPQSPQENLQPVSIAGKLIHPLEQDFYKELIVHRLAIGKQLETAGADEKSRLESDRLAIKILANSTSYGIFVELNVKDYKSPKEMNLHCTKNIDLRIKSSKFEEPGRYFHPLLGTLITGAARLMLALGERQVLDQGLDWAFCDTDSIAVANSNSLPLTEFRESALKVQDWFSKLNPYVEDKSILQLEKVNFLLGTRNKPAQIVPPECLTISAKRYVLFNRDTEGNPIIRKASGHGLGHLMSPYDEPPMDRRRHIERIGVPAWQEDVWREIIRAADSDASDQVNYGALRNFNMPAISRYAATTPELLKWFDGYNGPKDIPKSYADQVKPFNFLYSLQSKSRMEMSLSDMDALSDPLWFRREPRPAAPYSDNREQALGNAFDRDRPEFTRIPTSWLKSYARSLSRYHLHPEEKFRGNNEGNTGALRRRHIHAIDFQSIGKEADNIDEREAIGDDGEDAIEYPIAQDNQTELRNFVLDALSQLDISQSEFCKLAKISAHTMTDLKSGKSIKQTTLLGLVRKVEILRQDALSEYDDKNIGLELLKKKLDELGSHEALAHFLGKSRPYVTRLLNGERPLTEAIVKQLTE